MVHKHRYPCPHPNCSKTFSTSSHLSRHRRSMHSNGFARFKCPNCTQAEYSRRDAFRGHLLSCLAEQETAYFCSECKRAFAHRSSLLRHQRISKHKGQEQNFDERLLERVQQVINQCEAETGPLPQMPRMRNKNRNLRVGLGARIFNAESPELSSNDNSAINSPLSPRQGRLAPGLAPVGANPPGDDPASGIHSALIQAAMIASKREEQEETERQQEQDEEDEKHKAKMQVMQTWLQDQQPPNGTLPLMPPPVLQPTGTVTPLQPAISLSQLQVHPSAPIASSTITPAAVIASSSPGTIPAGPPTLMPVNYSGMVQYPLSLFVARPTTA